jgi:hypothetical protein
MSYGLDTDERDAFATLIARTRRASTVPNPALVYPVFGDELRRGAVDWQHDGWSAMLLTRDYIRDPLDRTLGEIAPYAVKPSGNYPQGGVRLRNCRVEAKDGAVSLCADGFVLSEFTGAFRYLAVHSPASGLLAQCLDLGEQSFSRACLELEAVPMHLFLEDVWPELRLEPAQAVEALRGLVGGSGRRAR